jgi:hypothetical protein
LVAKAEALVEATGGIFGPHAETKANPAASGLGDQRAHELSRQRLGRTRSVSRRSIPSDAGRQIAIAKGVRFGPKPKLTDHQQGEALKRLAAGASCRAIAKTMGVHHATIARLTGNHRAGSGPPPGSSEA